MDRRAVALLLQSLSALPDAALSSKVLSEALTLGIRGRVGTYVPLMSTCYRRGDANGLEQVLRLMVSSGASPREEWFAKLLRLRCRGGDVAAAEEDLELLHGAGVGVASGYKRVIKAWMREGNVPRAQALVHKMLRHRIKGVDPGILETVGKSVAEERSARPPRRPWTRRVPPMPGPKAPSAWAWQVDETRGVPGPRLGALDAVRKAIQEVREASPTAGPAVLRRVMAMARGEADGGNLASDASLRTAGGSTRASEAGARGGGDLAMLGVLDSLGDVDGVLRVLRQARGLSEAAWVSLHRVALEMMEKRRLWERADEVHAGLQKRGGDVTLGDYTERLKAFMDRGHIAAAEALFAAMARRGLSPGREAWRVRLAGLVAHGTAKEMERATLELRASGLGGEADLDGLFLGHLAIPAVFDALFGLVQDRGGADEAVFNAMLAQASKRGDFARLATLVDMKAAAGWGYDSRHCARLLEHYARRGAAASGEALFLQLQRGGASPTRALYYPLIIILVQQRRPEAARRYLLEMMGKAMAPETWLLKRVVQAFAHAGKLRAAETLLQQMAQGGVRVESTVYAPLVRAYARDVGDLRAAHLVIRKMRQAGVPRCISTYNELLHAHVKKGQLAICEALFEDLQQQHVEPDRATCDILINGYATRADADAAEDTFEQMRHAGFPPDSRSYSSLMRAYAYAGDLHGAQKVLERMQEDGVDATEHTCNYYLSAFQQKPLIYFDAVAAVLMSMRADDARRPSVHTYNIVH